MPPRMRRFALMRFDRELTTDDERELTAGFDSWIGVIPGLVEADFGRALSTAQDDIYTPDDAVRRAEREGYTHGLLLTFDSEESYRVFVAHPAHAEMSQFAHGQLGREAIVIDIVSIAGSAGSEETR